MKMRQSAASWFQRASRTSAPTSSSSDEVSDFLMVSRGSEVAMARIVMGVLAEARHAACDPVRGPIDELAERHARVTEEPRRLGGIDEPGVGRFDAGEDRRFAQALPEGLRQGADAHRLRPADVERARGHGAMAERAQHHGIGIALPDHVDVAGGEIDRRSGEHARGHVVQHAVAHVDRVVEADDAARRSARARKILEHGLACDAGIGVNAGRRRCRRRLGRAAVMHADKGVHAAGRIGDDARARERFGDQRRHVRVHRPSQVLVPGRAELAARHEHHVGKLRQHVDLLALEQVGLDAFDPVAGELLAHARLAEVGNADHAFARRRALGEAGERRPDLSAYAENEDVAGKLLQRGDQRGRRRGHHLLEVLHIAQTIGQRIGGLGHPGALSLNGRGRERACHDSWMLSGRRLGQQGAPEMALTAKRARTLLHRDSTVARAATANAKIACDAGKTCQPTYNPPRRGTRAGAGAMKVFMFHLMPYAYLDMNYTDTYRAAWVVLPNSYFDPKKGHELYNRYLDELELAAELGFDGISVNEHHQNAYGLMPSPVVMAAALARRPKDRSEEDTSE